VNAGSQWTPEVQQARWREQMRRANKARYRAFRDLAALHAQEYRQRYIFHHDEINRKQGPLPGD
jgi:hypothetical protein